MQPSQPPQPQQLPPQQWGPPPAAAYPYPPGYYPPPKSDGGKIVLIVVVVIVAIVLVTIVLSAILYVLVSGQIGGPGPGPQTIGIQHQDTSSNWVLSIVTVPSTHALTTTTFLMRWPSNSSIANPPGQATLQTLKTASGGVQYLPVGGASQTDLRVSDVITISKSLSYTTGMQITITDGQTILWTGVL